MLISIITIAYNNVSDIETTIKSVVGQTYNNIEYIIVDGGSTDGTLDIINNYKQHITKVISEPDNGIYDAINKGIKAATGEIVGMIHAGDRLYDHQIIQNVANHFENHDIHISYGHDVIVNRDDSPIRVVKSPEYNKAWLKMGWMPPHQSIYMKRSLFSKYGYYRTDIGGSGDYEFVIRYFFKHTLKIKRLDRYMLKFAFGGTSTSNYHRILKVQQVHANCWRLNGLTPPFYLIPIKLGRKIPQFIRAYFWRLNPQALAGNPGA